MDEGKSCCKGSYVKEGHPEPEKESNKNMEFIAIQIPNPTANISELVHEGNENMELEGNIAYPHECEDCAESQSESDKAKMIKTDETKRCCCKCKPQKDSSLNARNWEAFDRLFQMRMKILIGLILYFCLWLLIHFVFFV